MIPFVISCEAGAFPYTEIPENALDLDSTAFGVDGAMHPCSTYHGQPALSVGQQAAYATLLNAAVDYRFYGVEDRFKIVEAYARAENAPYRPRQIGNYVEWVEGCFIGKFENTGAFIKDAFTKSETLWLYDIIRWDDETEARFLKNFVYHDGYFFSKK